MDLPLAKVTVGILEHRFTKEFSKLLERFGASVDACPLLEEKPVENRDELQDFIRHVVTGSLNAMIFLTGVGAKFLVAEADSMGAKDEFLKALDKITIIVRGPKPVTALKQFGIHVDVVPDNATTEGVIEALRNRDLHRQRVGVQLYGTPNPQLVSALEAQGALVMPIQVYAYGTVADSSAVRSLLSRIVEGRVQVLAFTNATQVTMLFDAATQFGMMEKLQSALSSNVVMASIGEVTSRALEAKSLSPQIVPAQSKMGALAQAIADHFRK
jgi:uroporphyrinogen-III synthase